MFPANVLLKHKAHLSDVNKVFNRRFSFLSGCRVSIDAMRLLVVDDDPSVREALALLLDLNGFDVDTAADGREAIRTMAVASPDAVILDVLMPGIDGIEVCRRMRAIGDRTPVLMLTARTEVGQRVAGLEAGADDYLAKPFAREELIARLRALLRRTGWEGDDTTLRFDDLELDPVAARGAPRRADARADPHRVPAAGAADEPSPAGADPRDDLRARLGL